MTRDDIIRMAREAGFTTDSVEVWIHDYDGICTSELERFAKLAYEAGAAAERERCAQIVAGTKFRDGAQDARRGPEGVGTWHESSPMGATMRALVRAIRRA
jgi:hypothetical protein